MIDAFKTNGSSPPEFVRLRRQRARLARKHVRRDGVSRRDVWLSVAAILTPWLFAAVVTVIWWPR